MTNVYTGSLHSKSEADFVVSIGILQMDIFPVESVAAIWHLKRRRMPVIAYAWPRSKHDAPQFQSLN